MSNMDVWGATKTVLNNWIITLGSMGGGAKSNFFSMCNLSFISFFIPKRITEYKNTTFKLIVCPEPSGQVIVVNILYLWDQKTYSKCITYFCVCKTFMFMSVGAERQLWALSSVLKANFYSRTFILKFGCYCFKCIISSWQSSYPWYK